MKEELDERVREQLRLVVDQVNVAVNDTARNITLEDESFSRYEARALIRKRLIKNLQEAE